MDARSLIGVYHSDPFLCIRSTTTGRSTDEEVVLVPLHRSLVPSEDRLGGAQRSRRWRTPFFCSGPWCFVRYGIATKAGEIEPDPDGIVCVSE